jgi:hypothetical protein
MEDMDISESPLYSIRMAGKPIIRKFFGFVEKKDLKFHPSNLPIILPPTKSFLKV